MAIQRVPPAEAKRLMDEEGYVYVDVRTEGEYAAGHPVGAHNVPVMHSAGGGMAPNPDFLAVAGKLYAKDAKLVLGCRSGARSMRAAEMLIAAGYTNVIDQRAGFDGPRDNFGKLVEAGWGPAGLPVETATAGASWGELKAKAGK
jgi:rhodanese-related sulfurtransferase